jgi:hypothetical protein
MEITGPSTDLLRRHSWNFTDYPSHSSEHALSDFHLSGPPKNHRTGKRLAKDAEVKEAVTSWLQTPDTDFFYAQTQALVPWWDKWLNVNDEYAEVWRVQSATYVSCIHLSQCKFSVSEGYLIF